MAVRCPGARVMDIARLDDWRFHINTRGSASIIRERGAYVLGVLWQCTGAHIKILDEYEGVGWRNYLKGRVRVLTRSGRELSALVYISPRPYPGRARPNYLLGEILLPARHYKFPDDYLAELEAWLPDYARGEKMQRCMSRLR